MSSDMSLGISLQGWMALCTFGLVVSTVLLWLETSKNVIETRRNAQLSRADSTLGFYLDFTKLVQRTGEGLGNQTRPEWRIMWQRIVNKTFQFGEFMEVMEKLFPDYVREFERIFEIDEPSLMKESTGD